MVIRLLYSALMWVLQPLVHHKLRRRAVNESGYAVAVPERFGHYSQAPEPTAHLVWVHAVSMGEARAAQVLVAALRQQQPGLRLLLTHGTATGRAEGAKWLQPDDIQVWQPWDAAGNVRRFLAHFKPRIGILMETEVWPNMAAQCAAGGVPLVLANARMSEKSLRKSLWLMALARPAYQSLRAVWAQTAADAVRLRRLGATVCGVFGNIKFDATPQPVLLAQGRQLRQQVNRPVVMLASSREGEEASLLALLTRKAAAGDRAATSVQWLIVPRHPQRFDEVANLIQKSGFAVSRRSQWGNTLPEPGGVWLGDTLGEMALYYGLADVALLGGSFEPLGGQNLIEAAACACPVVMGPHTFNFAEAAELAVDAGAALRVETLAQGMDRSAGLALAPDQQQTMAQAALDFATAHQGATRQLADAIGQVMGIETP